MLNVLVIELIMALRKNTQKGQKGKKTLAKTKTFSQEVEESHEPVISCQYAKEERMKRYTFEGISPRNSVAKSG